MIAEPGGPVMREAEEQGFHVISVTSPHLSAMEGLPRIAGHGDPFDLLLPGQAQADDAALMTGEKAMVRYGVRCVGVA